MFEYPKGHQTLCDVLKKSILHKNPRKEGIGFERKLNEDGSYWEPHQYPQTVWVPAKSKMLDPALHSGYDSPSLNTLTMILWTTISCLRINLVKLMLAMLDQ